MRTFRSGWTWTVVVLLGAGLIAFPALSGEKASSAAKEQAKALSKVFADVAAEVKPAVVYIKATRVVKVSNRIGPMFRHSPFPEEFFRRFFEGPGGESTPDKPREIPQSGWGSGVVVDPKGDILTNNHVVAGATEITVHTSDGKQYEAEIVGTDPRTDLAVIRVKDKNASLPYARLGHSDALEVGEWVVAIGSPFGLSQTVTAGIVSAKGRSNLKIADYEDWIQTDAAINPGNSGGPLVNLDGEVVGINSAILTRGGIAANAGVGFAVPINMARNVMQQIIEHGKVTRSYMGVLIQPVTATLAEKFSLKNTKGALVGEVLPDSPAKKAGFQTGDVVVRYDGKEVKDYNRLRMLVAETKVGRKVKVDVIRKGKPKTLTVQPAELTDDKVASASDSQDAKNIESYGLGLQTLTPEIARQLGYEGVVGVVITSVEPGSAGAKAGLQRGDVILEVEREKVESVKHFQQKIKSLDKNKKALLLVKTKGGTRFAVLAIE